MSEHAGWQICTSQGEGSSRLCAGDVVFIHSLPWPQLHGVRYAWHGSNQYIMMGALAKHSGHCPCAASMACYTGAAHDSAPETAFRFRAEYVRDPTAQAGGVHGAPCAPTLTSLSSLCQGAPLPANA